MSERLGLFGGTFDPIHNAHLSMAEAAARECGLARVLFIPAANPPHRGMGTYAGYEDRYRMVDIACAGHPSFEPSRLESEARKSYSIDTVERFRAGLSEGDLLYFVIGADAFAEFRTWYRWQDLAQLVTFAVVGRPGAQYDVPDGVCVRRVDGVNLPVSSSGIRRKLAAGEENVDLPGGVLRYIQTHGLYRELDQGG